MGRQYLFYPHLLAFHLVRLPTEQWRPRVRCRTLGRLSVGRAFQDTLILLRSLLTASGACSTLVTYFTKHGFMLEGLHNLTPTSVRTGENRMRRRTI